MHSLHLQTYTKVFIIFNSAMGMFTSKVRIMDCEFAFFLEFQSYVKFSPFSLYINQYITLYFCIYILCFLISLVMPGIAILWITCLQLFNLLLRINHSHWLILNYIFNFCYLYKNDFACHELSSSKTFLG